MAGGITWDEKFAPDYLIEACATANLFTLPFDRPWKLVIVTFRSVSYTCKCDLKKQIFYKSVEFKERKEEFYVGQCDTCGRIVYGKL